MIDDRAPLAEVGAELELEDGATPEDEEVAATDCAELVVDAPPAPTGERAPWPNERVARGGMPSLPP